MKRTKYKLIVKLKQYSIYTKNDIEYCRFKNKYYTTEEIEEVINSYKKGGAHKKVGAPKQVREEAENLAKAAEEVFHIIESIKDLEQFQQGSVKSFISSLNTTLKTKLNPENKLKIEILVRLLEKYTEPKFETTASIKEYIIVEKGDMSTRGLYYYIIDSIKDKNDIKKDLEAIPNKKNTTTLYEIYSTHNKKLIKINELYIPYIHKKVKEERKKAEEAKKKAEEEERKAEEAKKAEEEEAEE
jgi:colicin import membrane protein